MGVRVDHSVGVLESCVAPFTCSLEWSLTWVYVDWFRRDLRVSRVPRRPERGRQVGGLVLLLLHLVITRVDFSEVDFIVNLDGNVLEAVNL